MKSPLFSRAFLLNFNKKYNEIKLIIIDLFVKNGFSVLFYDGLVLTMRLFDLIKANNDAILLLKSIINKSGKAFKKFCQKQIVS